MAKEIIHTDDAPKAVGPYVQAVKTAALFIAPAAGAEPGEW